MAENSELSEREIEILSLVASGKSNKEIAQELFISSNTVKVHLRNIFSKTAVSSRTEATLYAVRAGLVEGVASVAQNEGENSTAEIMSPPVGGRPFTPKDIKTIPPKWWQHPWVVVGLIGIFILTGMGINRLFLSSPEPLQNVIISPGENRWDSRADLPAPLFGQASAVYENQIFLIGGENSEGITAATHRYNPETDLWEPLQDKPTAVTDIQAAVHGGQIYVPGGRTPSGDITNLLEIYDPGANKWTKGPSLPVRLSAFALIAYEGKLYLFGGWDGENYSNRVFAFDPDQMEWTEKSPLPSARAYVSAVVVLNKIFILGGFDGEHAMDSNLIYFPDRDQNNSNPWESAAPLPDGRFAMGVVYIADKIYVLSGIQDENTAAAQLIFLPDSNGWIIRPKQENEPDPVWAHIGIAVVGPNVYALGGLLDGVSSNRNISFQAIYTVSIPVIIK
jgi:DNA-binding CsgD family transcriptional regulator